MPPEASPLQGGGQSHMTFIVIPEPCGVSGMVSGIKREEPPKASETYCKKLLCWVTALMIRLCRTRSGMTGSKAIALPFSKQSQKPHFVAGVQTTFSS